MSEDTVLAIEGLNTGIVNFSQVLVDYSTL